MKTLKSLKITSILQALYCIYCFVSTLLVVIGTTTSTVFLANIVLFLFYYFTVHSIMIAPICFFINLSYFLHERNDPEQKKKIGKKSIWIFIWPIITTIFYLIACLPFIKAL